RRGETSIAQRAANVRGPTRPPRPRLGRSTGAPGSVPCGQCSWVPINESWGVPGVGRDPAQRDYVRALYHLTRALYHLTRALDPTRPVIGNDGWEHVASDIWGIHDYALDGAT